MSGVVIQRQIPNVLQFRCRIIETIHNSERKNIDFIYEITCFGGYVLVCTHTIYLYFLKDFYVFLFLERGDGKEKERNINVCLPLACPLLGDLARNPGTCPDWESNQRPFGSQAGPQSTEPRQPGIREYIFNHVSLA